jgi:quinol monooxygenase YgiN
MGKVALNVTIDCFPGSRNEVICALLAHRERCLKHEPGTLQFEVLVPVDFQHRIYLFELYRDDSALDAHIKGSSISIYLEEVGSKVQSKEICKCLLGNELPV